MVAGREREVEKEVKNKSKNQSTYNLHNYSQWKPKALHK